MSGKLRADQIQRLAREEVRGRLQPEIIVAADADQQQRLGLTPAQRPVLAGVLAALDAGTATTLAHQRATARLIRMIARLA